MSFNKKSITQAIEIQTMNLLISSNKYPKPSSFIQLSPATSYSITILQHHRVNVAQILRVHKFLMLEVLFVEWWCDGGQLLIFKGLGWWILSFFTNFGGRDHLIFKSKTGATTARGFAHIKIIFWILRIWLEESPRSWLGMTETRK